MTLKLRSAAVSDRGLVRSGNEDAVHAGEWLVAVADGMGGMAAGDLASALAIGALAALDGPLPDDRLAESLRQFDEATALFERADIPLGEHYIEHADVLADLRLLPESRHLASRAVEQLEAHGVLLMAAEARLTVAHAVPPTSTTTSPMRSRCTPTDLRSMRPGSVTINATRKHASSTGMSHDGPGTSCSGIRKNRPIITTSTATTGARGSPTGGSSCPIVEDATEDPAMRGMLDVIRRTPKR